jgi:hypothetical protein
MINWLVWLLYFFGQLLHILSSAYLAIRSNKNNVQTLIEYLKSRVIPLVSRLFLSTLAFIIVWDNPKLNIEFSQYITNGLTQAAMAGILGWFSDSLFDKVVALIPWLGKELPVIHDGQ